MSIINQLKDSHLGQRTNYTCKYDPSLLQLIERSTQRLQLGLVTSIPFHGHDIWNAYEISWLNAKGKPMVATATFVIPCHSPYLIESKSFKLYLNSYNNTHFTNASAIHNTLHNDLSSALGMPIQITLTLLDKHPQITSHPCAGTCLDSLDITTRQYTPSPELLSTTHEKITETVYSNLLRSNCPITNQPDWATISIQYSGPTIEHTGLLAYLISYRNHNEFHEHCIERIFLDIFNRCKPEQLTVYARYTRRGGLDINPYRSSLPIQRPNNFRQIRQ